jgi:dihydropteroate synthase
LGSLIRIPRFKAERVLFFGRVMMRLRGYDIPTSLRTCVMGVLNVTPDSFSDGGKYLDPFMASEHAVRMVEEGADIIDIGAESSRPGAERVSAQEELNRVLPVIKAVARKVKVPISIDTWKSEVAKAALLEGAALVNDITALRGDPAMAGVVAEAGAGVVLMHMKGEPENMQAGPVYGDVVREVISYLAGSVHIAETAGIPADMIAIDPGIGFGKTLEHNLEILRRLSEFKALDKPILVGTSRKSFIGKITGRGVTDRVFGTAASVAAAIMNGADIVRVHDVGEMAEVARMIDAINAGV